MRARGRIGAARGRRPGVGRARAAPAGALLAAGTAMAVAIGTVVPAAGAESFGLVAELRARGATVTPLGRAHGLEGYLVRPGKGGPYTLYVTAGGAGVAGALYDPAGVSVSAAQLAALRAPAAPGAGSAIGRRLPPPGGRAAASSGTGCGSPTGGFERTPAGAAGIAASAGSAVGRADGAAVREEAGSMDRVGSGGGADGASAGDSPGPAGILPGPFGHAVAGPGAGGPGGTHGPAVQAEPAAAAAGGPGVRLAAATRPGPGGAGSWMSEPEGGLSAEGRAALRLTELAPGFDAVPGAPKVHVFVDPACSYSRRWLAALSREARGRFGVRAIPVGVLGEWSALAAMWVLERPDMAGAWERVAGLELGEADVGEVGAQLAQANNALLMRWRPKLVPLTVFRDRAGEPQVLDGLADDVGRFARAVAAPDAGR